MGRKGVSKRKPKQQKSSSNGNAGGSTSTRSGGNAVAALVKDTGAPLINRSGPNSSAGSNKKRNQGR